MDGLATVGRLGEDLGGAGDFEVIARDDYIC